MPGITVAYMLFISESIKSNTGNFGRICIFTWLNVSGYLVLLYLSKETVTQYSKVSLQCGRPGFDPWVVKIPWRRERLPTPVFWPGDFYGLYSPWGHRVGHYWVTFTFTAEVFGSGNVFVGRVLTMNLTFLEIKDYLNNLFTLCELW